MDVESEREIERFWSRELGSAAEVLSGAPGLHCTTQRIYNGVQLFRREGRVIVAAPPSLSDFVAVNLRGLGPDQAFSVRFVERVLSPYLDRMIGPAHVGYADHSTFLAKRTKACRLLSTEDAADYQTFAACLSSAELEQSGFDTGQAPAYGVFCDN